MWPRDWSSDVCSSDPSPTAELAYELDRHLLCAGNSVKSKNYEGVAFSQIVKTCNPLGAIRYAARLSSINKYAPCPGRSEERRVGNWSRARGRRNHVLS